MSVEVRREAVALRPAAGCRSGGACTLLCVARSALCHAPRKVAADAPVVARMGELARQYPRYGYRRMRVFLGRAGHAMSAGRAYRL